VDGDVETEKFDKGLVVTEAEKGCEVGGVVLVAVDGRELSVTENVAVYAACNVGELGNAKGEVSISWLNKDEDLQVHGILEGVTPVFLL
jgi:hypothetical protein